MMPRAFLVVMDSVGIGGAPDAYRFFNDDRPEVYSAEAAALAWNETIEFFRSAIR
jgi:phosphopentomutase